METLDFFTPVVDDPYVFGRVAAANAFSDVYAMGGKPIFALNIVAFPVAKYGTDALAQVLAGGSSIATEADVSVLGGHSIDDPEPKYGMVVTGLVHPDRVLRNIGGGAGDALILTKPLGSGIITTGIKKGRTDAAGEQRVIEVMTTLNRAGAEAMIEVGVNAATDVTGFGLLGHLLEMLKGGGLGARLEMDAIPLIEGATDLVEAGVCPGGTHRNLAQFGQRCDFDAAITETEQLLLADAQTSGGLLIACPADRADALLERLRERRTLAAARIGSLVADASERIAVVR